MSVLDDFAAWEAELAAPKKPKKPGRKAGKFSGHEMREATPLELLAYHTGGSPCNHPADNHIGGYDSYCSRCDLPTSHLTVQDIIALEVEHGPDHPAVIAYREGRLT